jgi:hypothetical protein
MPKGKWKMVNCILFEGRIKCRSLCYPPTPDFLSRNISRKGYPHRDLSTALPGFPVEFSSVD